VVLNNTLLVPIVAPPQPQPLAAQLLQPPNTLVTAVNSTSTPGPTPVAI
jgi:hypothetical protein